MHDITAVSHACLVQQTGQFVDDAAAVVDTLVAIADCVLLVDAADLVSRLPIRKMKCRITINLLIPVRVIWLLGDIGICYRGFGSSGKWQSGLWFIGDFIFGLLTYRGYCNRAFGLSGNLLSGFWFIGDLVIGLLTYRGFVIGLMVIGLLAIGLMSCSQI